MSTRTEGDTIQVMITLDPKCLQEVLAPSSMDPPLFAATPSTAAIRFQPTTLEDGQEHLASLQSDMKVTAIQSPIPPNA